VPNSVVPRPTVADLPSMAPALTRAYASAAINDSSSQASHQSYQGRNFVLEWDAKLLTSHKFIRELHLVWMVSQIPDSGIALYRRPRAEEKFAAAAYKRGARSRTMIDKRPDNVRLGIAIRAAPSAAR
jgi:hypothetical protein